MKEHRTLKHGRDGADADAEQGVGGVVLPTEAWRTKLRKPPPCLRLP